MKVVVFYTSYFLTGSNRVNKYVHRLTIVPSRKQYSNLVISAKACGRGAELNLARRRRK